MMTSQSKMSQLQHQPNRHHRERRQVTRQNAAVRERRPRRRPQQRGKFIQGFRLLKMELSSSPPSVVRRSSRIRNNSGSSNAGSDSDASSSSTSDVKRKTKKTARKKLELDPIQENKEVVFSPPRSKKSAPVEVSANNDNDSELITFS